MKTGLTAGLGWWTQGLFAAAMQIVLRSHKIDMQMDVLVQLYFLLRYSPRTGTSGLHLREMLEPTQQSLYKRHQRWLPRVYEVERHHPWSRPW